MSKEIAIQAAPLPQVNINQREEWMSKLNAPPETTKKQADYKAVPDNPDFDTIPIGVLENTLDEVYMGLWRTSSPTYQVVANEIIGSLILEVFDPLSKVWISRIGAGAVTIRQSKGSAITDIGSKIKTALQMDFPKLYSMCLKNAAKTLGKKFGRDLNRKFEDTYEQVYSNEIELNSVLEELKEKLQACKTRESLLGVWNEYPQLENNTGAKKLFRSYLAKINLPTNG